MIELDKPSASRLAVMVESGLVSSRHTVLWADSIVKQRNEPPVWVLELAAATYKGDVLRILQEYAFSEPFENLRDCNRDYLACLFLRCRRREISWATFLYEAGRHADARSSDPECEYFYGMLNELEHAEYSRELETSQVRAVEKELEQSIALVDSEYKPFLALFREWRKKRG